MTEARDRQVLAMRQWCLDHYSEGADVMVECWDQAQYAALFDDNATDAEAWDRLKTIASVYDERQADAINSAF
jgi:hypothetical protein